MSEPDGAHEPGNDRLDRIERTLNLLPAYRIQFRHEYQVLLNAQMQMQRGLEELRKNMDSLTRRMENHER